MPTPEQQNKATMRRFQEALEGDVQTVERTIDELVDPDVLIRTPLPIDSTGREALKDVFGRLHRAFPDLHIEIEDLIAEGDKVVSRNTVTGTHIDPRSGCRGASDRGEGTGTLPHQGPTALRAFSTPYGGKPTQPEVGRRGRGTNAEEGPRKGRKRHFRR